MKPMWPVLLFNAAAAPTRNEPSFSANSEAAYVGGSPSTVESTMPNVVFGFAVATVAIGVGEQEADADDRVGLLLRQQLEVGQAILVLDCLELDLLDAELADGLVEAAVRRSR